MTDTAAPAAWTDGHPQLEAIAAAVWEQCRTEETGLVVDDPRNIAVAALSALLPPAARSVLRDRIAEALMRWAERGNSSQYAAMRRPETVRANAYSRADAVLAVLPPPADRAAVLRWAADALDSSERLRDLTDDHMLDINAAANELRRMADETPAAEVEHCVHDRAVHTRRHHQPVTGCPWCATAEARQDGARP